MKYRFYFYFGLFIIVSFGGLLACSNNETPEIASQERPMVTISSLSHNETAIVNQELKIQSTASHSAGIARVELVVDGQVIWRDGNPQPEANTPYLVVQSWTPQVPGSYLIQVRAFTPAEIMGESTPIRIEVTAAETPLAPTTTPTPDTATMTPVDTATTTPNPSPSPTDTPAPSATPTLGPTPTSTPTPGVYTATDIEPQGRFREIWVEIGNGESRLGYPTTPELVERNFAKQYFERGLMFWWDNPDDPNFIWAIDGPEADLQGGQGWNRFADTWSDDLNEYGCDQAIANGDQGPVRGFGKVWCDEPALQTRLGRPIELEAGSGGTPPFAQVQFYQGGVMIYNPINREVYVLYDQGDWLRFED